MPRPRHLRHLLASLAGLACALLLACQDDTGPLIPCPVYNVGAVEGYLLAGGSGAVAEIGARSLDGIDEGQVTFRTMSDSTGWYRLEMPAGRYEMEVNPSSTSQREIQAADTIHLGTEVRRRDLFRGRITVHLSASLALEGERVRVWLEPVDRTVFGAREELEGSITGGTLVLPFPIPRERTYLLVVELVWHRSRTYWYPGTLDQAQADTIPIAIDRPTRVDFDLTRSASLAGTVRGSSHVLGERFDLEAYSADSVRVGFDYMGEDGTFEVFLFEPQPVKLSIGSYDFPQWVGGDSFESATRFDVTPGVRTDGIEYVESGILCTLEGAGLRVERGAEVFLADAAGRTHRFSDENPVAICNLRPGRYWLFVRPGGCDETWAAQWYDGAFRRDLATPIEVGEGALVRITAHIVRGGRIRGRVFDSDGGVDTGHGVYVELVDPEGFPGCEQYDEFDFRGLRPGEYRLKASTYETREWWYPGTADPDSARTITIAGTADVAGIEWRLPGAGRRTEP